MIDAARQLVQHGARRSALSEVVLWVLIIGAAGLVGLGSPLLGGVVDGVILARLTLLARSNARWADAALGLAMVPLLRVLWLVMPTDGVAQLDWVPLIGAPLVATSILAARNAGLTRREVGLATPTHRLLAGAGVVAWVVGGLALAAVAGDSVAWAADGTGIAWGRVIVYAPLIALAEELAFRGVLPAVLERVVPRDGMWLATLACLTLALGMAIPWWAFIGVVVAVGNGMLVARTGSLPAAMAGHALFLAALNL